MKDSKMARIVGLAAPLALMVALGASTQTLASDVPYAHTSRDNAVTNSYGECWQTSDGKTNLPPCAVGERVAEACPDADADGVCDDADKCPGTPPGARVNADGCEIIEDVTLNLVNDDFDFDKATLKPKMKAALNDLASRVTATQGDEYLTIIGHTDSKGTDQYNQRLSERRAKATAAYLANRGISADHITTQGMGESQPVADNRTDAGRAKNRRVEIQAR